MNGIIAIGVLFPFIAAIFSYFAGKKFPAVRNFTVIASCVITFVLTLVCALAAKDTTLTVSAIGLSFRNDGFHTVYALITAFMWLCAALISPQYFKEHHNLDRYNFFFLVTLGATLGVFLSADLITTFTFFEIMSFTSYAWVIQEEDRDAMAAGKTYLTVAVLGGMVCLMGLFLLWNVTGTLVISELNAAIHAAGKSTKLYIAAFCMLVGFGAKAGLFPLHIWLPKAHPVAPAPASALLSGVLTKAGVFGILIITGQILRGDKIWGYTLLALAAVTMVLGAVLAVFSVNLKRTLACSSLSQIGFILVGTSMIALLEEENALAANGTFLYMINHSIVKLVLFLTAGAIYMGAHTLDLNKLRGYGRGKPFLAVAFAIGACSLAGIPGFCGYLSKTLVHESIVEFIPHGGTVISVIEWLFLFSGGLTAAYMIKLFIAIFIEKPTENTPKYKRLSPLSATALGLSAIALPILGVLPTVAEKITAVMLPLADGHHFHHQIHYFSFTNLKGVLISLSIGIAVYTLIIRPLLMKKENGQKVYVDRWPAWLSMEKLVYIPIGKILIGTVGFICNCFNKLTDVILPIVMSVMGFFSRLAADITDVTVLILRKTLFSNAKEPQPEHRHKYAYALGAFMDRLNKREDHRTARFLVRVSETLSKTNHQIFGNFSFALLMTCLGICIILTFLILSLIF